MSQVRLVHACILNALVLGATLLGTASVEAAGLGRLFFTPEERKEIDDVRRNYDPTRQEIIVKEAPTRQGAPPPPPLPELSVQGVVLRSGGRNAAWINGARLLNGETTEDGVRVEAEKDGRTVRFILPGGTDTGPVKPGQLLDPNAGTVKERFRAGSTPDSSN